MAKKDAYYFSHDSNARYDDRILEMRAVYGYEGYGIYWALIETLRDATNYKLEKEKIKSLSIALNYSEKKLSKIIQDFIKKFKLFKENEKYFWSESLLRRMKQKDEKSKKMQENAEKRWKGESKPDAIALQKQSKPDALKESKVNEIKESKEEETKTKEIENWGGSCLNGIDLKVTYLNKQEYAYNVSYNHYPKKYGDHAQHLETFRKYVPNLHEYNRLNLAITFYKEKFTGTLQQMKPFSEFVKCYKDYL